MSADTLRVLSNCSPCYRDERYGTSAAACNCWMLYSPTQRVEQTERSSSNANTPHDATTAPLLTTSPQRHLSPTTTAFDKRSNSIPVAVLTLELVCLCWQPDLYLSSTPSALVD